MKTRDWMVFFATLTLVYWGLMSLGQCHLSLDLRLQAQTGGFLAASNAPAVAATENPMLLELPPILEPDTDEPELVSPPLLQRVALMPSNALPVRLTPHTRARKLP